MKRLVVLSGAGISAESGIKTFRDADGLWEGHDVMEVASPEGWNKNPSLVLDFYNQRRKQLLSVEPNLAHHKLSAWQDKLDIQIITQNVDDLHERAGSKNVVHLHGELLKSRSIHNDSAVFDCKNDINIGQKAADGGQLRPHIVWFGEAVPEIPKAAEIVNTADTILIIGTSMQVYPAAGLVQYARPSIPIIYIDPRPSISWELKSSPNLTVIENTATEGILQFEKILFGL
jgi:NAD-dependent deacetylase